MKAIRTFIEFTVCIFVIIFLLIVIPFFLIEGWIDSFNRPTPQKDFKKQLMKNVEEEYNKIMEEPNEMD